MFATSVDIDVKRCLCIHSMAQLVDITLQSLLYQRQLVPEPVPTFIKHDSHAAEQFSEQYQKVARILQETFRSPNAGLISEFVILIGGTPYSPKEIYRIRVPTCRSVTHETDQENSSRDNGQPDQQQKGCVGPVCDELTAKEKRLVFSAVALSKTAVGHFENCPIPGKTDKVFMFIRTRGQLNTWTEGLAEDESFELPEDDVQQRRKIHQLRVQVHAPRCDGATSHGRRRESNGCDGGSEEYHNHRNISHHDDEDERDVEEEEEADENMMTLWYRIAPFFTNLH